MAPPGFKSHKMINQPSVWGFGNLGAYMRNSGVKTGFFKRGCCTENLYIHVRDCIDHLMKLFI